MSSSSSSSSKRIGNLSISELFPGKSYTIYVDDRTIPSSSNPNVRLFIQQLLDYGNANINIEMKNKRLKNLFDGATISIFHPTGALNSGNQVMPRFVKGGSNGYNPLGIAPYTSLEYTDGSGPIDDQVIDAAKIKVYFNTIENNKVLFNLHLVNNNTSNGKKGIIAYTPNIGPRDRGYGFPVSCIGSNQMCNPNVKIKCDRDYGRFLVLGSKSKHEYYTPYLTPPPFLVPAMIDTMTAKFPIPQGYDLVSFQFFNENKYAEEMKYKVHGIVFGGGHDDLGIYMSARSTYDGNRFSGACTNNVFRANESGLCIVLHEPSLYMKQLLHIAQNVHNCPLQRFTSIVDAAMEQPIFESICKEITIDGYSNLYGATPASDRYMTKYCTTDIAKRTPEEKSSICACINPSADPKNSGLANIPSTVVQAGQRYCMSPNCFENQGYLTMEMRSVPCASICMQIQAAAGDSYSFHNNNQSCSLSIKQTNSSNNIAPSTPTPSPPPAPSQPESTTRTDDDKNNPKESEMTKIWNWFKGVWIYFAIGFAVFVLLIMIIMIVKYASRPNTPPTPTLPSHTIDPYLMMMLSMKQQQQRRTSPPPPPPPSTPQPSSIPSSSTIQYQENYYR
jgi:hypothetical protein